VGDQLAPQNVRHVAATVKSLLSMRSRNCRFLYVRQNNRVCACADHELIRKWHGTAPAAQWSHNCIDAGITSSVDQSKRAFVLFVAEYQMRPISALCDSKRKAGRREAVRPNCLVVK
jgi:hypothetical protein